ncbi:unnamed protein product [Coffea canephora]|uniref:Uncharacterized protein n=1 Tax=Coffea canephora TaxID=49390 RepID=A0A068VBZ3_COFCA|nr:unnamed protein product [Coffea canephora]
MRATKCAKLYHYAIYLVKPAIMVIAYTIWLRN